MSLNGNNYVQLILNLKAEKAQIVEDTRQLKDELDRVQANAYNTVVQLNAEIANKYFKEVNHDIPFSTRISAAVSLMENEIKRLELGMDMTEHIDEELDVRLEHLKAQLTAWGTLRNEIRSPVQESATFKKAVKLLERSSRDDFPVVDSLMQIQGEENKFLENANTLADSVHSIVQRHEADMNKRIAQVDIALRENVAQMMDNLSQQGDIMKQDLQQQRREHREGLNDMYMELLSKFLKATEVSNNQVSVAYHKMERRKLPIADISSSGVAPDTKENIRMPSAAHKQIIPPPPLRPLLPPAVSAVSAPLSAPPTPVLAQGPPSPPAPAPPLLPSLPPSAVALGPPPAPSATAPKSWKSEIDQLYMTALREDRQRRELEAEIDKALLVEFDETKITVLDHGMGDEYLHTLMEKLTSLYIESSEIDLRRMRSTIHS